MFIFQTISDAVRGFTDLLNGYELHDGLVRFSSAIAQSCSYCMGRLLYCTAKVLGKETLLKYIITESLIIGNLLKKDF
jgi:hypothetical protein